MRYNHAFWSTKVLCNTIKAYYIIPVSFDCIFDRNSLSMNEQNELAFHQWLTCLRNTCYYNK